MNTSSSASNASNIRCVIDAELATSFKLYLPKSKNMAHVQNKASKESFNEISMISATFALSLLLFHTMVQQAPAGELYMLGVFPMASASSFIVSLIYGACTLVIFTLLLSCNKIKNDNRKASPSIIAQAKQYVSEIINKNPNLDFNDSVLKDNLLLMNENPDQYRLADLRELVGQIDRILKKRPLKNTTSSTAQESEKVFNQNFVKITSCTFTYHKVNSVSAAKQEPAPSHKPINKLYTNK